MQTPPPRNLPRFLPTLTEVVHLPAESLNPVSVATDPEQLVSRVMQRLDGNLKSAVQAAINDLVREQLQVLEPILMQEVEMAVRQAVLESLGQGSPSA